METVYRIMGLSAGISERLSRIRGNGIPLNWLLMVAIGIFGAFACYEVSEALVNSRGPRNVPLSALVGKGEMEDRWISTRGQFVLGGGMAMSKKDKPDEPDKLYIPIVDVGNRSAVYVEVDPDPAHKPADMDSKHVSGMVRKMDHQVKEELGKKTQRIADIPIDTDRMIVAGDRPARAAIWIPVALLPSVIVLMMLLAFVQRYVVFRRMREPIEDSTPGAGGGMMRVTGRFSFGPKTRQRFHNMPAVIAELEGGMIGLVTQTDASVKFMGTVTQERKGVWLIPIRPGTLGEAEFGRYYFSGGAWPALRIRYTDDASGNKEWAILAFDSLGAMRQARQALFGAPVQE